MGARGFPYLLAACALGFFLGAAQTALAARSAVLSDVETYAAPGATQIVLEFASRAQLSVTQATSTVPPRITLTIAGAEAGNTPSVVPVKQPGIRSIRFQDRPGSRQDLQCVIDLPSEGSPKYRMEQIFTPPSRGTSGAATLFLSVECPDSLNEVVSTSTTRSAAWKANEMKIVVIDPGHGGHFPGACHNGLKEKDIVLDVSYRLAKLINQSLNMRAVMTRTADYSPGVGPRRESLAERRRIAVQHKGDLFLSIHCNSSGSARRTEPRGWELYYLSRDKAAVSLNELVESNPDEIADLVMVDREVINDKSLLRDALSLSSDLNIQQSRSLAEAIATELRRMKSVPARPKTIQPARFDVLTSTSMCMPTVLVELAFLTNPSDVYVLKQEYYRDLFATHLYNAVTRFFSAEPGFQPSRVAEADSYSRPQLPRIVQHKAQQGDSLVNLALTYNSSVEAIRRENHIQGNRIFVGKTYRIPVAPRPTEVAVAPAVRPTETTVHVVRKGETLVRIAALYDSSVDELVRLNRLTGTTIRADDRLRVPARSKPAAAPDAPTYTVVSHKVTKGETLSALTERYGCSLEELKQVAELKNSKIVTGTVIRVPSRRSPAPPQPAVAKAQSPPPAAAAAASTPSAAVTVAAAPTPPSAAASQESPEEPSAPSVANLIHTVKAGDNLFDLARQYGCTMQQIRRVNDLNSSVIHPGSELRIPVPSQSVAALTVQAQPMVSPRSHKVRRGDTLMDLARKYKTSVQRIQRANGLSGTRIDAGQVLVIP